MTPISHVLGVLPGGALCRAPQPSFQSCVVVLREEARVLAGVTGHKALDLAQEMVFTSVAPSIDSKLNFTLQDVRSK